MSPTRCTTESKASGQITDFNQFNRFLVITHSVREMIIRKEKNDLYFLGWRVLTQLSNLKFRITVIYAADPLNKMASNIF